MDGTEDLLHTSYLRRRGIRAQSEVAQKAPRIARIRRGVYIDTRQWDALQAAERYRLFVIATVTCMRSSPLVCGLSAAALWNLPIVGGWPTTLEVLGARGGPGSTGHVVRRRVSDLPTPSLVDGVQVTSPARTVVDVARTADFAPALTIADAALSAGLCTLTDLDTELDAVGTRARGRTAAANVVLLADGRSESPGESLSRARMWQLGVPQPRLQVPLLDERGPYGRGDFGWPGVIGEFDGNLKYRADQVSDAPPEDSLWREKLREDRIRRHSRVVRWTWQDAWGTHEMARKLAEAGIEPGRSTPAWVRGDPQT